MSNQNEYLRFSAQSMKALINEKLEDNGNFTDQIFEDSNLSTLIDIFSYMFSTMLFYLNNTGAEGTYTDTQLYENINRAVKILGYNPLGFITSTVTTSMNVKTNETITAGIKTIPKFTTYTTDLTDVNGNPIKYTFIENFTFTAPTDTTIDSDFKPILYNGSWKLYNDVYVSTGFPFETFTMNKLILFGTGREYVSHNHIIVYVKDITGNYTEYKPVTNLYNSKPTDTHYEVRINENYQYTLKFGDNINGKQLQENSELYVVYLSSNGPDGQIGAMKLDGTQSLSVSIDGLSEQFIKDNILKIESNPEFITFGSDPDAELENISLTNPSASTIIKDFETVEQVKQNAPNWFRMGGRLITSQDFEQYILMNYPSEVYDVKVTNNWEYMVDFQNWLNTYGKLNIDIRHYDYQFSDSCDFNNIYIWLKTFDNSNVTNSTKRIIERDCDRLKPLTAELVMEDPLLVTVVPYLKGKEGYNIFNWDPKDITNGIDHENKIQLVRDRNTMITVERIKQKAVSIIQDFFATANNKLGQTLNINNLYNSLSSINGVKQVRTKYLANGSAASSAEYYDGLSFAIWTQHIIEGADLTTISGSYKLKSFQFPFLLDANNIANRIEVASDSFSVADIEY